MRELARMDFITREFTRMFRSTPTIWAQAPGRVDLMGSHTDYNLGFVMTMSIDRTTWIAARPRSDRRVAIHSLNLPGGAVFSLDDIQHDEMTPWSDYVGGMAWALQEAGYELGGFDGLVHSTIPFGSGLSSSAALEMATAVVFREIGALELGPVEMALLGQKAENQFVGMSCGILDQYSSTMGQEGSAILLDCRDISSRPVSMSPDIQVVICDTRAKRELTGSEYGERRMQCEEGVRLLQQWYPEIEALRDVSLAQFEAYEADLPKVVARRCRFIIEENQRVLDLAEALPTGNRDWIRQLTAESYVGARDPYEIGAPSMAAMMEAMLGGPGVIGARQAGAGFGGCMVAFVELSAVEDFAEHVRSAYAARTDITPEVYPVQAAPGAALISNP